MRDVWNGIIEAITTMKLSKQILSAVAVAGLAGIGATGAAVYCGKRALDNRYSPDGEYHPLNAFEQYGLTVGYKLKLIDPPPRLPCGMCGMG